MYFLKRKQIVFNILIYFQSAAKEWIAWADNAKHIHNIWMTNRNQLQTNINTIAIFLWLLLRLKRGFISLRKSQKTYQYFISLRKSINILHIFEKISCNETLTSNIAHILHYKTNAFSQKKANSIQHIAIFSVCCQDVDVVSW